MFCIMSEICPSGEIQYSNIAITQRTFQSEGSIVPILVFYVRMVTGVISCLSNPNDSFYVERWPTTYIICYIVGHGWKQSCLYYLETNWFYVSNSFIHIKNIYTYMGLTDFRIFWPRPSVLLCLVNLVFDF